MRLDLMSPAPAQGAYDHPAEEAGHGPGALSLDGRLLPGVLVCHAGQAVIVGRDGLDAVVVDVSPRRPGDWHQMNSRQLPACAHGRRDRSVRAHRPLPWTASN
jgi:hypothetical protein